MPFTSTASKGGVFPTPVADEIVHKHLTASGLPAAPEFFIDPVLNPTPGPKFGSPLSRAALGPALSRHRNLQTRYLQKLLPLHKWTFTSASAYFSFIRNAESMLGRSALKSLTHLELEIDFFAGPEFDAMLRVLESLGREAVNGAHIGPSLPGLKQLTLKFVQIPFGFQDFPGMQCADDRSWLFDWVCVREAVAEIRVADVRISGLRSWQLAQKLAADATGVTERRLAFVQRLRKGGRWPLPPVVV